MPTNDNLGQFEVLNLAALMILGDNAYGMTIHEEVERLAEGTQKYFTWIGVHDDGSIGAKGIRSILVFRSDTGAGWSVEAIFRDNRQRRIGAQEFIEGRWQRPGRIEGEDGVTERKARLLTHKLYQHFGTNVTFATLSPETDGIVRELTMLPETYPPGFDVPGILPEVLWLVHRGFIPYAPTILPDKEPPKAAEFLFCIFLDARNCDAIVGDLEGRYPNMVRKFGVGRANFWYWTQTITSLFPIVWAAMKRLTKALTGIAALVELYKKIRS